MSLPEDTLAAPLPDLRDLPGFVRTRLQASQTRVCSDLDLNADLDGIERPKALRPAAVLVPLIARGNSAHMVFTTRAAHLRAHRGQVAFPGGRLEPDDPHEEAAALREAEEEIGLAPERVEVLGHLSPYETITGFRVTPIVGFIADPPAWRPDPGEVADVFETPFERVMEPKALERRTTLYQGTPRTYYALTWQDRVIWGATAGMLADLRTRLGQMGD